MCPTLERLALLGLVVAAGGCRERPLFSEAMKLGGQTVAPEVLNEGYDAYTHYCRACHGDKGDGHGPSAPGMRPPPRDFTAGVFKFGGVSAGELPNDVDLEALVKNGLAGTPMLPWDISDRERHATIQYIKTFSERWKTEEPGKRLLPASPDPWLGKEALALELGKQLYHLSGASQDKDPQGQPQHLFLSCGSCHPNYLARTEIAALSKKLLGVVPEFRQDMYRPEAKESDFLVGDKKMSILPPDLLFHPIKNGTSHDALFRSIASGVAGTAMPTWAESVKTDDLWALVHYVKYIADLRGSPQAAALRAMQARQ